MSFGRNSIVVSFLLGTSLLFSCGGTGDRIDKPDPVLKLYLATSSGNSGETSVIQTYPGTSIELKVMAVRAVPDGADASLYTSEEVGPAANQLITWGFTRPYEDITMEELQPTTTTNAAGIASMTFNISEYARIDSSYFVEAYTSESQYIQFTVRVKQLYLTVTIVGNTSRSMSVERTDTIRAVVRNENGVGVPDVDVTFSVNKTANEGLRLDANGLGDASNNIGSRTVLTDSQGIATVYFFTGSQENSSLPVNISVPNADTMSVTYKISRTTSQPGGECTRNEDCPQDMACVPGTDGELHCSEPAVYCEPHAITNVCPAGQVCTEDRICQRVYGDTLADCNYACQDSECTSLYTSCSSDEHCTSGSYCDGSECVGQIEHEGVCLPDIFCDASNPCPTGFECVNNSCIPIVPLVEPWDVSGVWFTSYNFNLTESLGFLSSNAFTDTIDFLALLYSGQLAEEIDIPILGSVAEIITEALLEEYVPEWVEKLVTSLSSFIHIFDDVQARGVMLIAQPEENNPVLGLSRSAFVTGLETWDHLIIHMADLCENGGIYDPDYPTCAEMDLAVDNTIAADWSEHDLQVGVYNKEFIGTILENDEIPPIPTLTLEDRKIDMEMRAMVIIILDSLAGFITEGEFSNMRELICDFDLNCGSNCVCDPDSLGGWLCEEMRYLIEDIICDWTDGGTCDIPLIQTVCEASALAAAKELDELIAEIDTLWSLSDITAEATVHVPDLYEDPRNTPATELQDGTMTGTTEAVGSSTLSGSWRAARSPEDLEIMESDQ